MRTRGLPKAARAEMLLRTRNSRGADSSGWYSKTENKECPLRWYLGACGHKALGDTDSCSLKQAMRGFQLRSDPQSEPTFPERLS